MLPEGFPFHQFNVHINAEKIALCLHLFAINMSTLQTAAPVKLSWRITGRVIMGSGADAPPLVAVAVRTDA